MPRLTAARRQLLDEMMKEAIYNAAVAVLAENGLDGLTMDRVAAAAEVAKGSLYNYFEGKQQLLTFIHQKAVAPILESWAATADSDLAAVEKLAQNVRTLLEYAGRHAAVFDLLFRDDRVRGLIQSSERSARGLAVEQLTAVFRQGIAEGQFRPNDPRRLAQMFVGLCAGLLDEYPEARNASERPRVVALILDTFMNGAATGQCSTTALSAEPHRAPAGECRRTEVEGKLECTGGR